VTAQSWALDAWAVEQRLSDPCPVGTEPATAVCDAWVPPHPLALPTELCARLRAAAVNSHPYCGPNGTYYLPELSEPDRRAVVGRFQAANGEWWQLDLDRWDVMVKRYRVGEAHPAHTDWHPAGGVLRKFAGSVQLSDQDEYDGARLVVHFAHHRVAMPAELGALVAFPGWTVHEVEQVTRGERWALIVNGFGPALR
jgi:hypothetical protein